MNMKVVDVPEMSIVLSLGGQVITGLAACVTLIETIRMAM
jgi:hypothetical protein